MCFKKSHLQNVQQTPIPYPQPNENTNTNCKGVLTTYGVIVSKLPTKAEIMALCEAHRTPRSRFYSYLFYSLYFQMQIFFKCLGMKLV